MNDPHVVALIYRIDHIDTIDYSKAKPFTRDGQEFRLTVENNRAKFDFLEHYDTVEKARESLAEYIRIWEFHAQLKHGPDSFRLQFENHEIIDRNPTMPPPGEVSLIIHLVGGRVTGGGQLTYFVRDYPKPPENIALNPDVETMYGRYMGYREGREPLASMAYFCLSMLEDPPKASPEIRLTKKRKSAAEKFGIDKNVLAEIGRLSSTAGKSGARKREGVDRPISERERRFLQQAVKAIIRRMAEKLFAPNGDHKKLSFSDLPSLGNDIESNTTK